MRVSVTSDAVGDYEVRSADPVASRELGRAVGVDVATAQVLLHRGICNEADARSFLEPRLSELTNPACMADRFLAADRLARAVVNGERIAVFGDYDVDGTASAAILSDILEALGADVVVMVGNRFDGGYGFGHSALARCREAGARVVVTCDCGSSDHETIRDAGHAGVDVIVVDHHLVPHERLPAFAFLNPHRPDCGFPYKGLASVGLVFLLAAAIRAALGRALDLRSWLDLVALGTIADVAPLDGDNRRLVRAGLAALSSPRARPGLRELKTLASFASDTRLGAWDVAFRLAPRLNAAGRLGDPSVALKLLRAKEPSEARRFGDEIEALNHQRKAVGRQVTEEARAQVQRIFGPRPRSGVVVAAEGWHRGVVGITAARLVDEFRVPVVVVAIDGDVGHASCRGPESCDLHSTIEQCKHLLLRFGGHRRAAGFSLPTSNIGTLRDAFAALTCTEEAMEGRDLDPIWVDVELDGSVFPVPDASQRLRLEPVGESNAEPIFAIPHARLRDAKVVGDSHLRLELEVGSKRLSAFGASMASRLGSLSTHATLVGWLRPDTWRGGEAVELRLMGLV